MVEKAGTGCADAPAEASLYGSKPEIPYPCSQEQHEAYIHDLCGYYVKQLDLDSWLDAERHLALFKQCYLDGWTNREFTF